MAIYPASKAFVLSFSEALTAEYGEHGVRVMALCPGEVKTNFAKISGAPVPPGPKMVPEQVVEAALKGLEHGRSWCLQPTDESDLEPGTTPDLRACHGNITETSSPEFNTAASRNGANAHGAMIITVFWQWRSMCLDDAESDQDRGTDLVTSTRSGMSPSPQANWRSRKRVKDGELSGISYSLLYKKNSSNGILLQPINNPLTNKLYNQNRM